MKNDNFFLAGLFFTGFSAVQFISFLGAAYPVATNGAIYVLMLVGVCIFIVGLVHWVGLKRSGQEINNHIIIGFLPAIVVIPLFILCILGGIQLAQNTLG